MVEEAQSYTEEVRRIINTEYGFEKVYSEGFSISTPLNGKYQIAALNSLRLELNHMISAEVGGAQLQIFLKIEIGKKR